MKPAVSAVFMPGGGTEEVCVKGIAPLRRTLVYRSPQRSFGGRWKTITAR